MADPRFFKKPLPIKLSDAARIAKADMGPGADPDMVIHDVASLESASAGHIAFLDNLKYREAFSATKASACIISPRMAEYAPKGISLLLSDTPYKSYALLAQAMYPKEFPAAAIADTARIDASASIGKGCIIGEYAVIGAGADIGAGTWIESHAVIGPGVVMGGGCRVGSHASISHAVVGSDVHVYPGARIGQDGFGFAIDPAGHVKVPQLGRVVIGDHVEIGSNTCIDRGAGPDTVIGEGTWIDNLVQIAHNVQLGRGCVIVGQSGIAGSTVMEDYSVLAAQAGIAGHLRIGKGARIAAKAGVMRDVPAGEEQIGMPAQPAREFMRQVAALKRLTKGRKGE